MSRAVGRGWGVRGGAGGVRGRAGGVRGRAARPPLVIGAGCSRGCSADELGELVRAALAGLPGRPAALATIDGRAGEPCMLALAERYGVPLVTHPAEALAAVAVPTPSALVARHVGTPSVAEAAALLSAGADAVLVAPKRRSAHATCAVAAARETLALGRRPAGRVA